MAVRSEWTAEVGGVLVPGSPARHLLSSGWNRGPNQRTFRQRRSGGENRAHLFKPQPAGVGQRSSRVIRPRRKPAKKTRPDTAGLRRCWPVVVNRRAAKRAKN